MSSSGQGKLGIADSPPLASASSFSLSLKHREPEAERRQLTVMFCDLVGSTALSEKLDPEELREVVQSYQALCAEVVARFEGYIAQYLGDGVLVYFGYPRAHEDDAQRAVRAALGLLAELHRLDSPLPQSVAPLQVRIGIHTGLVVVGKLGRAEGRDHLALGETPNIAARLQGLAASNTVVVSAATYQLIAGYFTGEALGAHALKGLAHAIELYRVLGESGVPSRFEVVVRRGLTPLVGREEEMGLLRQCWEHAKDGHGQVVLLGGEPGIGKSRLVQVLQERLVGETYTQMDCHCSPYYQHSALHPVIDLLQRVLQFKREDPPPVKLAKLESALASSGLSQADKVPFLASLLSLPLSPGASERSLELTPQKQKEKTQEALLSWLLVQAESRPLLMVCEDLHWADPSTLEWLGLLIEQAPMARLLLVLIFRPEFRPPWSHHSYLTPITLSRLSSAQAELMVGRITARKALPREVLKHVVSKTDGVPLFLEELTKMVLESGLVQEVEGHYELTAPLPPLAIPTTLQDSLIARLDRLSPIKEVAQLGAILGREFSYELLQAVSPLDETRLPPALVKLVEAEVLYRQGWGPKARYLFKHALIQEAAYQSLLKSKRQQYHQKIAQVLEERFAETCETQPELLAHHYTEAGLTAPAIPYWQRAGERAVGRSANVEAIAHLTKGLALLKTLPPTPEHAKQELALRLPLGIALITTRAPVAPEVMETYTRLQELCEQVGETPQLFQALSGLAWAYLDRGEYRTMQRVGEQLLTLAQSEQDPALLAHAHHVLGGALFYLGEFASAHTHLMRGIALYDPRQFHSGAFLYGAWVGWRGFSRAALALWYLGYPDQALQKIQRAIALAQELSHPYSLTIAMVMVFAAWLHLLRGEAQAALEQADVEIVISRKHGWPLFLALGTALRGSALFKQGRQVEEGIAQIRQGLTAYRAIGAGMGLSLILSNLSEALAHLGRTEEGLTVLAEAFTVMEKNDERIYEAELYRLKGELLLSSAIAGALEAEACFHQAVAIAQRQGAKSIELRAVVSLSRLWQQQGKKEEARQRLTEIYGWFTEGFDTADLQAARTLLHALS